MERAIIIFNLVVALALVALVWAVRVPSAAPSEWRCEGDCGEDSDCPYCRGGSSVEVVEGSDVDY